MNRVFVVLLLVLAGGAAAWFLARGDPDPGDPDPGETARPRDSNSEPPTPSMEGMAWIRGGPAQVGTEAEALRKLLAPIPQVHRKLFRYEVPRHQVTLEPHFIGTYEVTNAQYRRFLRDHEVDHEVKQDGRRTLDDIAAALAGLSRDAQRHPRQRVWRQLYEANKERSRSAVGKQEVRRSDGSVDEGGTAAAYRHTELPVGLRLRFFGKRPPSNWPGMEPPPGQEDHPVRYVSYNDAAAMAEWSGAHLPTEQEWEWAARGPEGPRYPWGDAWFDDASHVNWGGKVVDKRYRVTTLPVDGLPAGRSWCGCHHMVGNVNEWTSSWFQAYPGSHDKNSRMGHWVKVIRGGGAADAEPIVLRPACRNYVGGGADAPPYPENSFEWCGFRLAAYPDPVRDRLPHVQRRATRHKKIKTKHLDLQHHAGAATRHWAAAGSRPADHVYATGRSHAVLVIPMRSLLRPGGLWSIFAMWKGAARIGAEAAFERLVAYSKHGLLPVGVLHTDIALEEIYTPKRGNGRPTSKRLCTPGTYLLALQSGRLALFEPNAEFVCYVPRMKREKHLYRLEASKATETRRSTLIVDPVVDWADVHFEVPLGGKSVDATWRVVFDFRLPFEIGEAELAGFEAPPR